MGIKVFLKVSLVMFAALSLVISGCTSIIDSHPSDFSNQKPKTPINIIIGEKVQKPNAAFKLKIGNDLQKTIHVQAILPLEPDAHIISGEIPMAAGLTPSVDNLYTAKMSYKIKDGIENVKSWSKQHFIDNGFICEGSGQSINSKDHIKTDFYTFKNITDPNFTVSVSFNKQSSNTLMKYALNYVYIPLRGDDTKILTGVDTIMLSMGKMDQASQSIELKDPAVIESIIKSYNELPFPSGGIHGCLMDDGTRLNMTIILNNGKKIVAIVNPACFRMDINGDFGLQDSQLKLYNYLRTLIPELVVKYGKSAFATK